MKEFFYVDVERARSMLAQLDRGIVEGIVSSRSHALDAEASARVFGIGGGGSYSRQSGSEESRSLQDLTYVIFEEKAIDAGLIVDVADAVTSTTAWSTGSFHASLSEGQLLRISADVQVLDPRFFLERLERVDRFADALLAFTDASQPGGSTRPTKGPSGHSPTKAKQAALKKLWGETDPKIIQNIAELTASFMGDAISVRVLPCGEGETAASFGGVLLGRNGYIQEEREALFSRYGSLLRGWTMVMQVASIPGRDTGTAMPDFTGVQLMTAANQISRPKFERLAIDLVSLVEAVGIAEGPRWPSITVTPIALYREVRSGGDTSQPDPARSPSVP